MKKQGFTLLELVIVIIIIGILATLAIFSYRAMKESALNQEAIANLKLIQAAERTYRMEYNVYYNSTDANGGTAACHNPAINANLRLSLPGCSVTNFNYRITADATSFTALAVRNANVPNPPPAQYGRNWNITQAMDEPVCTPAAGGGTPVACK